MGLKELFKSKEEKLWDLVYKDRQMIWESIGPFPNEIRKVMNLSGVWPGGCLVQLYSEKLGRLWFTSSFGLTNSDMPTKVQLENYRVQGNVGHTRYDSKICLKTPRQVPNDWAGYGYEIALLTREKEEWPYMFLNTVIQMEILQDIDLLERVYKNGAVTMESIRIGENEYENFIVFIAPGPLPSEFKLSNGIGKMLLAMTISEAEMKYALDNGQSQLLNILIEKGEPPISDLNRQSIL